MSEPQLALTPASAVGEFADGGVLDGAIVAGPIALERRNLSGEVERIAGRAASVGDAAPVCLDLLRVRRLAGR